VPIIPNIQEAEIGFKTTMGKKSVIAYLKKNKLGMACAPIIPAT
jgi:hypothetical protein